jgi:hypothetical protein
MIFFLTETIRRFQVYTLHVTLPLSKESFDFYFKKYHTIPKFILAVMIKKIQNDKSETNKYCRVSADISAH